MIAFFDGFAVLVRWGPGFDNRGDGVWYLDNQAAFGGGPPDYTRDTRETTVRTRSERGSEDIVRLFHKTIGWPRDTTTDLELFQRRKREALL